MYIITHIQALREFREFLIVDGEPDKKRQGLLRNCRIVHLLVEVLNLSLDESDCTYMYDIIRSTYQLLYNYLVSPTRKGDLYLAKHMSKFMDQIANPVTTNIYHAYVCD